MSVKASSSLSTDGSSSTRLCMGYFWILDRLESELRLPRRQRLVCHSNLPRSAGVYAENEQYEAIMDDLTKQGVFASNYSGLADLADIHIAKLPSGKVKEYHDNLTGFSQEYINYIREVEKVRISFSRIHFTSNRHIRLNTQILTSGDCNQSQIHESVHQLESPCNQSFICCKRTADRLQAESIFNL